MKKWLVTAVVVAGLAGLAASAQWWLPLLLTFVGANSDLIQGLTDLAQLVLWAGAGLAALFGLWRSRKQTQSSTSINARDNATLASQGSVAARQVAVGRDVYGDVILVADPDQLWQIRAKGALLKT